MSRANIERNSEITNNIIREGFSRIMTEYPVAQKQPLANHPLAIFIRKVFVETLNNLLIVEKDRYRIVGSAGQGRWAFVPWISCFDRTQITSATNGIYLVYLIRADMSGFYLSLNQGYTYYRDKYGPIDGKKKIAQVAIGLREKVNINGSNYLTSIDLRSTNDLATGYEKGHILGKYYDFNTLPSDDEFIKDFHSLLEGYKRIILDMNGRTPKEYNDYLVLKSDHYYLDDNDEQYQSTANLLANNVNIDVDKRIPRPPKDLITDDEGKKRYPRDAREAAAAIREANYKCSFDPSHKTFTSKKTGKRYCEAHHLIGIAHQNKFSVDLDVRENICSLCATCHRTIHFGIDSERLPIVEYLYHIKKENLEQMGMEITLTQLKQFYDIDL